MKIAKLLFAVFFIFLYSLSFLSNPRRIEAQTPTCGDIAIENDDDDDEIFDTYVTIGVEFKLYITNIPNTIPNAKYQVYVIDKKGVYNKIGTGKIPNNITSATGERILIEDYTFNVDASNNLGKTAVFFGKDLSSAAVCKIDIPTVAAGEGVDTCIPTTDPNAPQSCGSIETSIGTFSNQPGEIASQILKEGSLMGGGIALVIMILATLKIITSRGNPEALQSGRELFTSAIVGLLVIIFGVVILQFIGRDIVGIPNFGFNLHFSAYAIEFGEGNTVQPPPGFNTSLNSVGAIISAFLTPILALAGMLTLLFLIWGGFKYVLSRGDAKAMDSARATITSAIIGMVIIGGIFVIIQILQAIFKIPLLSLAPPTYAATPIDLGEAFKFGGQGVRGAFPSFGELISSIIKVLIPIGGIIFLVILMWGGIRYMLSRGDDKAVASARSMITSALIGLLIIVGSFIIISIIEGLIGIDII